MCPVSSIDPEASSSSNNNNNNACAQCLALYAQDQHPVLLRRQCLSSSCKAQCIGICGDGVEGGEEECDDGNVENGDGCSTNCVIEMGYSCIVGNKFPSTCTAICGDGRVVEGEACDDGNRLNLDGCSGECTIELGFECTTNHSMVADLSTTVSTCTSICGDGVVVDGEACDDHNVHDQDGCSSHCEIESGYVCSTLTGACSHDVLVLNSFSILWPTAIHSFIVFLNNIYT